MRRIALVVALALGTAGQARADTIEFEVTPKVFATSRDKPTLTLHNVEDCDDVVVKLTREDGKPYSFRTGRIAAGTFKKFPIEVPPGREYKFTGTIERRSGKTVESLEVKFVAEIVVPAKLAVDQGHGPGDGQGDDELRRGSAGLAAEGELGAGRRHGDEDRAEGVGHRQLL